MLRNALLAVLAGSCATTALAQDDPNNAQLKQEIERLKQQQAKMQQDFDDKIKRLEEKLDARSKAEKPPVKIEALLQSRMDFDSDAPDSFYFRRLELKFSGKVNPKASWTLMLDPAKELKLGSGPAVDQRTKMLQDAYITLLLDKNWSMDIGQRKIPIAYEALMPTSALDTLERALFMSQGKLADVRDVGIQATGRYPEFDVTVAALNGTGESQNGKDPNDQKTFGGRAVFHPTSVPGLHLGASELAGTGPNGTKNERTGFEIQYKRNGLTLRSEYATGIADDKRANGWYGHAGYRFLKDWEGVIRYDTFDPDNQASDDDVRDLIFGVNTWSLGEGTLAQFNLVNRRFGNGGHRTFWQFGMQVKF
ncbi:MAG: hypothetical protein JSS66_09265 [Armatimonadetes bacterium]|nr:hypothetical protein [Armatimonadota bacterium]